METSSLKDRLNKVISDKKIKKGTIAKAIGVHAGTLDNYIKGKVTNPNNLILEKISDYLGISSEWLVNGTGDISYKESSITESYIGNDKKIEINKFLDVFFLYRKEIEKNERFIDYLELGKKDAIIKYQNELITKIKNEE